jgi:hypothetical protein
MKDVKMGLGKCIPRLDSSHKLVAEQLQYLNRPCIVVRELKAWI